MKGLVEPLILAAVGVIILAMLSVLISQGVAEMKFKEKCEKAGGAALGRHYEVCLAPGTFIRLEE